MTNETVTYEKFRSEMSDILSSGNGMQFMKWHEKQLRKLFNTIRNRDVTIHYLNTFYSESNNPSEFLEGELDEISELINGTCKVVIQFE